MNPKMTKALGRHNYDVPYQTRLLRTQALTLSIKTNLAWLVMYRKNTMPVLTPELCANQWYERGYKCDTRFYAGVRERGPAYQINVYELPGYDPYTDYHDWEVWHSGTPIA